jgi:hypothetical protein
MSSGLLPRRHTYRDLPTHQARHEQVAGLGELLVRVIEPANLLKHRFYSLVENGSKRLGRNGQAVAIETIILHALATRRTDHAFNGVFSERLQPSCQINKIWAHVSAAKDDKLCRPTGDLSFLQKVNIRRFSVL